MTDPQKTALIIAAIGFAPTLLAFIRLHHQKWAILILNVASLIGPFLALGAAVLWLGGGTVLIISCVGWLLSLVWSVTAVKRRENVAALIEAALRRETIAALASSNAPESGVELLPVPQRNNRANALQWVFGVGSILAVALLVKLAAN